MSTSPRSDADEAVEAAEPHIERAEHIGAEFDSTIARCRATALAHPELRYVAHYGDGVFHFSLDWLDQPARRPRPVPPSRHDLRQLGQALSFTLDRMDRALQEARSGGMIRMVLHTASGAAFTNAVVPRKGLVGIVLDHPVLPEEGDILPHSGPVRSADQAMSAMATELRDLVRLRSANPGGWETVHCEPATSTDPLTEPFTTTPAEPAAHDAAVIDACRRTVNAADLQFLAYCADDEVLFTADRLDDRALGPFFTVVTIAHRRKFYEEFSRELGTLVIELSRTVRGALGGPLNRLVLDVEQGAVYYYRLRPGAYLVGVTLDQSRVNQADERIAELARQFGIH